MSSKSNVIGDKDISKAVNDTEKVKGVSVWGPCEVSWPLCQRWYHICNMKKVARIAFIKEQEMKCPCECSTMQLIRHRSLIYSFLKRVVFFRLPVVLFGYQLWKWVVFQEAFWKMCIDNKSCALLDILMGLLMRGCTKSIVDSALWWYLHLIKSHVYCSCCINTTGT